jgi:hypothetical protein
MIHYIWVNQNINKHMHNKLFVRVGSFKFELLKIIFQLIYIMKKNTKILLRIKSSSNKCPKIKYNYHIPSNNS